MLLTVFLYVIVFLYGITIGSFLNVLIFRLPRKENIVTTRSHCMSCGYQLKWYDLIPLFSYLALGGKCRKCKARLSVQYPLIEGLNGALYLVVYARYGISIEPLLYCLLASALLALSVIDLRTYEIPQGFQYFILVLGAVYVIFDRANWLEHVIGFFAVSGFLYVLVIVIDKIAHVDAMGWGDVKLMATCGLLLGWKQILLAFMLGCILGSVIHLLRMWLSGQDHVLAFGPYLAAGVMLSALWGERMIAWYLGMLGL